MVENDPLGIAFNVKAFHRCQVNNLLRAQLIPHDPDYVDTSVLVTRNTPGSGISVVEKPVPIVSSNYNNPSLIRNREDLECDQDDLKRARLNNGCGSYRNVAKIDFENQPFPSSFTKIICYKLHVSLEFIF